MQTFVEDLLLFMKLIARRPRRGNEFFSDYSERRALLKNQTTTKEEVAQFCSRDVITVILSSRPECEIIEQTFMMQRGAPCGNHTILFPAGNEDNEQSRVQQKSCE